MYSEQTDSIEGKMVDLSRDSGEYVQRMSPEQVFELMKSFMSHEIVQLYVMGQVRGPIEELLRNRHKKGVLISDVDLVAGAARAMCVFAESMAGIPPNWLFNPLAGRDVLDDVPVFKEPAFVSIISSDNDLIVNRGNREAMSEYLDVFGYDGELFDDMSYEMKVGGYNYPTDNRISDDTYGKCLVYRLQ